MKRLMQLQVCHHGYSCRKQTKIFYGDHAVSVRGVAASAQVQHCRKSAAPGRNLYHCASEFILRTSAGDLQMTT